MAYSVDNAVFQWEEGGRRLGDAPGLERLRLEEAVDTVLDELRRRLGSSFTVEELADLYATDVEWALELAAAEAEPHDAAWIVDAAFYRYAREAANFAGGRHLTRSRSG